MNGEPEITTIPSDAEAVNTWALVEIFGHSRVAGRVTTRKLGTEVMFQVDVPKGDTEFTHSELYSPKSVFSIKPTTEAWCRRWANAALAFGYSPLPYIPQEPEPPPQLPEPEDAEDGEPLF